LASTIADSRWIEPLRHGHGFELQPEERTKPVVIGDVVYAAGLEGHVVAMHRTDGYMLWSYEMPAGVDGSLAYGRSKLFVGDTQGNLIALNARDGSVAWKFKIGAEWLAPVAVIRDRVIAMTSSEEVYALSDSQGKEIWHFSHRGDEKMTIRGTAGPATYGNEVYQGFSDGSEIALSVDKGDQIWQKKLRTRERFYDVDMTAYVDETSVIAASFDGRLMSLNRLNGDTRWMLPVGSYGGFVAEENRLYFAGLDNKFYAVERENGRILWSTPFAGGVAMTPTRVGDTLVFTSSSDPVYILDRKTGEILDRATLGTGSLAGATGADDWFYCLSNYGNLYSFQLRKTLEASPSRAPRTLPTPSLRPRLAESERNPVDS
jgi:outer membrane protein assembly factor BamB